MATSFKYRKQPARNLRRTETAAEKRLWKRLCDRRLAGFKFRRQYPVGIYFADFCCFQRKLIVELDGNPHDYTVNYDQNRSHFLNRQGFQVLRFSNHEVFADLTSVCTRILQALQSSERPLLPGEGGARSDSEGAG